MEKWEKCRNCGGKNEIVQDKPIDDGIKRCVTCSKCGYEDTFYLPYICNRQK